MSAVRMVAYGVLEYKPAAPDEWLNTREKQHADNYKRDELKKLVNDELKRYGLILGTPVLSGRKSYRHFPFTLYGQVEGRNQLFSGRPVLHEGSFQECCAAAARVLDQLDAAQVPDTATGLE